MAKTSTKAKGKKATKSQKYDPRSVLCRPSTWVMSLLLLALLIIYGVSIYGFKNIEPKTALDSAKLAVFDNLISEYVRDYEINKDKPSVNEVTGYGISDEDGAFYVTFDFLPYTVDENSESRVQYDDTLQHAIMYFWKDEDRGTYSHAFSYHDDYYHPGGTYVEVGDHYLRNQLNQATTSS